MLIDAASAQACLLTDGVVIAPGAVVERSIRRLASISAPAPSYATRLLSRTVTRMPGVHVERAIIDKNVIVGPDARGQMP